jgi:penicillin-insensitive murein endopeptidase
MSRALKQLCLLVACVAFTALPREARASRGWDVFGLSPPVVAMRQSPTKPVREPYFPFLPDEDPSRSVSIGTAQDGLIVNAVPLPQPGQNYAVLPRQLRRGLIYGSQELIGALTEASDYVARVTPGSRLWIGNIGRHGGGDIIYSVSHNAGRDADLAFYTTDAAGRPVDVPDIMRFDDWGRSRDYGGFYRFDVPRNWALVKALATSSQAPMQYLFISNGLRRLLLDHAAAIGEPPAVTMRAASLLRQPGPEIPHDDHLHVRIRCSRFELGAGCLDANAVPGVVDAAGRELRSARIRQASLLAHGMLPEVRRRAAERIAWLGGVEAVTTIRSLLVDPVPRVREAAAVALGDLAPRHASAWVAERWEEEPEGSVRRGLLLASARIRDGAAISTLESGLVSAPRGTLRGKPADLRLAAIDAVADSGAVAAAPALARLLLDASPEVRARSVAALRLLANRDLDGLEYRSLDITEAQRHEASARWLAWYASLPRTGRDAVTLRRQGFALLGVTAAGSAAQYAAALATLAGDARPWVSANAQLELVRMSGNPVKSRRWSAADAQTYWTKWVRRNPGRFAWRTLDEAEDRGRR